MFDIKMDRGIEKKVSLGIVLSYTLPPCRVLRFVADNPITYVYYVLHAYHLTADNEVAYDDALRVSISL